MKIIQSFWTNPIFNTGGVTSHLDRLAGGWLTHRSHLLSWALSCCLLRLHYESVELVTDTRGKEILIDKLQLPYTQVSCVLDSLDGYNPDLWALGKIVAYSKQSTPFIHVDSDVFLWSPFEKRLEQSPLACQNFDLNLKDYSLAINQIRKENFFIPAFVEEVAQSDVKACNAGILGGTDLDFFARYTSHALNFVDQNKELMTEGPWAHLNIVFEQLFFYALAKKEGIEINPYFGEPDNGQEPVRLVRFHSSPHRNNYLHVISKYKKSQSYNMLIDQYLRMLFPEYYFRVIEILSGSLI